MNYDRSSRHGSRHPAAWRVIRGVAALGLLAGCSDLLGIEQKVQTSQASGGGARPPERPSQAAQGTPRKLAFAARKFYFGAIEPGTGEPNPDAWRRIGFDLDGRATSASGGNTCQNPIGDPSLMQDGEEGRDNNWGAQLIPAFGGFGGTVESTEEGTNRSIEVGGPTLVVTLSDLHEGPDDSSVQLGLYVSAPMEPEATPVWNGSTSWPIDARTVEPGSMVPKMRFAKGYMNGNTVVSGDFGAPADAPFLMPFDPSIGVLALSPLTFTLTLELDDAHTRVRSSTLSMVLRIGDMVGALHYYAVKFGALTCGGLGLLDSMLRPYADLRADAPDFQDPTRDCDAMSVAFELDWEPVALPLPMDLVVPLASDNPCSG